LSDVLIEAGMVPDVGAHEAAARHVHRIDARLLGSTPVILATSPEVAGRIERFNGLRHNVDLFEAGLGFHGAFPQPSADDAFEHVLCVSRHEFPKRTELFVQAMQSVRHEVRATSVGAGGRLGWAMRLDAELSRGQRDPLGDGRDLWCTNAPWLDPEHEINESRVRFAGHVDAAELDVLYRKALCVVAPAYLEDYGLTAVEAMAYGKPLVVCNDGGNLASFVEDGVNGFVVEPSGKAIAEAVQRLVDDPVLAARFGREARERARGYTWERAMSQFTAGLERVMA
jgi:glycosyltransferase involved in cell wall biosynthesis